MMNKILKVSNEDNEAPFSGLCEFRSENALCELERAFRTSVILVFYWWRD